MGFSWDIGGISVVRRRLWLGFRLRIGENWGEILRLFGGKGLWIDYPLAS